MNSKNEEQMTTDPADRPDSVGEAIVANTCGTVADQVGGGSAGRMTAGGPHLAKAVSTELLPARRRILEKFGRLLAERDNFRRLTKRLFVTQETGKLLRTES
jgi:hypothetical protein